MKKQFIRITVSALTLGSFAAPASADQRCKQVKLDIKNPSGKDIKNLAVNYHDKDDGKWRTEGLSKATLNPGELRH